MNSGSYKFSKLFLTHWLLFWATLPITSLVSVSIYGQALSKNLPGKLGANASQVPTENLNLSDRERHLSQTYEDKIGAQNQIKEKCAQLDDPKACESNNIETKFMGIDSDIVRTAAQMYSLVIPILGRLGPGPALEEGEGNKKKRSDPCQYIAIATESLATFQQKSFQQNISDHLSGQQSTQQKEFLNHAARSHRERAKNYKIQATGWGVSSVCYLASLVGTKAFTDKKLYLKLGATSFMALFFSRESRTHEDYYRKIKKIADGLPAPGDCNPVTQTHCFCSKPKLSPQDLPLYKKYCQPLLHENPIAQTSYRVPCVDQDLKADPKCTLS